MSLINTLLGLDATRLTALQMILRAVIVFFLSIIYVRVAGIRTLGKKTVFDQVTTLILGTLMGNAIFTGTAPFFPILAAALTIMLLHRFIAWLTFKSDKWGKLIKGDPLLLVKEGEIISHNLDSTFISKHDYLESLRINAATNNIKDIEESYLERSGDISFIKTNKTVK